MLTIGALWSLLIIFLTINFPLKLTKYTKKLKIIIKNLIKSEKTKKIKWNQL